MNNLNILWHHRKKLLVNIFVTAILSAVISLILPKTFLATAVVVPPAKKDRFSQFALFAEFSDLPGGLFGQEASQISMFRAILESRTLLTNVAEKFDLQQFYGVDDIEKTIEKLAASTEIEVTEENTINISVSVKTTFFPDSLEEDFAKKTSAKLTNEFVAQLDKINRSLSNQQSRSNRLFIEQRYRDVKKNLAAAEDSLMNFKETHGVIALSEQVRAAIEIASIYESELGITEIKYNVLKSSVGENNSEVKRMELEIEQLKMKISGIHSIPSNSEISSNSINKIFPLFSDIPELGKYYIRVERDMRVQDLIFKFMTQELEQAKIEEARDTPTVQVIDIAIPPIKKHAPVRFLLVLFATFLSSTIYVSVILGKDSFIEFISSVKN